MTPDQAERVLALLERIARELEAQRPTKPTRSRARRGPRRIATPATPRDELAAVKAERALRRLGYPNR